jgi:5-formaminoimidazole-4-carboxamide-1-(beta)-D-ribofuranosyl 5'-monophosphate synthetase
MKPSDFTIATLGSHSALQILKGGKDEGFRTLLVSTPKRAEFYRRFPFVDDIIPLESLSRFSTVEPELLERNTILIPHGSFVAYLGSEGNRNVKVPYFGNKRVLDWEEDRQLQRRWLEHADIQVPRQFCLDGPIDFPVIVKT